MSTRLVLLVFLTACGSAQEGRAVQGPVRVAPAAAKNQQQPPPTGSVAPVATYSPPTRVDDFGDWSGTWRIAYFVLSKNSNNPAMAATGQAKIGKKVYLGATRVSMEGVECMAQKIESSVQPAIDYVWRNYKLEAKALDIGEPSITVITSDCAGTPFAEFIARNGELIVHWEGVLYKLRKE